MTYFHHRPFHLHHWTITQVPEINHLYCVFPMPSHKNLLNIHRSSLSRLFAIFRRDLYCPFLIQWLISLMLQTASIPKKSVPHSPTGKLPLKWIKKWTWTCVCTCEQELLTLIHNWRVSKISPEEFQAILMHQHGFRVSSDLSAKLML